MKTLFYLTDPAMREIFLPGVVTGLAIAIMCAALSVLVVLKRLAFVGQGISHAAFGGAGVVATLGWASATGALSFGAFGVVFGFCLLAALAIGWLSLRGKTEADTAIGIVLVASMALGAVLLTRAARSHGASRGVSWESFLFGSMDSITWADAMLGWGSTLLVGLTLWAVRRPLVFWAFDPVVARAVGVREPLMSLIMMALLALATVTAMKLAGVVLATAMLVLPGASALLLSRRSTVVLWAALLIALSGVIGGVVLSFEADWPTGPSIVVVLSGIFAIARVVVAIQSRSNRANPQAGALQ